MPSLSQRLYRMRNRAYARLPFGVRTAVRLGVDGARTALGAVTASRSAGTVCMLHTGRCGSSVLGGLLNQHRRILWDAEIHFKRWEQLGRRATPYDPADLVRRRRLMAGSRWYGFEAKFADSLDPAWLGLTFEGYLAAVEHAGVSRWIILERRNVLRQVVSVLQGRARGSLHNTGGKGPSLQTIPIDVNEVVYFQAPPRPLASVLDEIVDAYDAARRLLADRDPLHLTYEDHIAPGPHLAYARVCEFLGLPAPQVELTHRKVNPFPLASVIENIDDVRASIADTRHAWMLEDDAG